MARRPSNPELILGLLLVANILFSVWLYQQVTRQEDRLRTLERNDAINQQVDKLNEKYEDLKNRAKDFFN